MTSWTRRRRSLWRRPPRRPPRPRTSRRPRRPSPLSRPSPTRSRRAAPAPPPWSPNPRRYLVVFPPAGRSMDRTKPWFLKTRRTPEKPVVAPVQQRNRFFRPVAATGATLADFFPPGGIVGSAPAGRNQLQPVVVAPAQPPPLQIDDLPPLLPGPPQPPATPTTPARASYATVLGKTPGRVRPPPPPAQPPAVTIPLAETGTNGGF